MNERDERGRDLTWEDVIESGFSEADINSPLGRPQGHSVTRRYEYTPLQRGGTIPIYSVSEGGMKLLKRIGEAQDAGGERLSDGELWRQVENSAIAIGDVPVEDGVAPSGLSRVMAKQVAVLLMAVSKGQRWPARQERALQTMYKKMFGAPPERVWIVPFMRRLEKAASHRLNWERRLAKLDEREREKFPEPPELLKQAEEVLGGTRRLIEDWPGECRVPNWLTVLLVAYLIPRVGFNKGGGARRVLSNESLVRLLAEPLRLIKDLESAADGARRWSDEIELLQQEVANAQPKGTPSSKPAKPAGMSGQGGKARTVPKA